MARLPESAAEEVKQKEQEGSGKSSLVIRCMADIEPEKIEWLWPCRIAIGKQTLIGGEPGLGKSQITAALAAAVTTGGEWPCNEGRAPRGSVIILSAEDDASDTIRPRLDAAGANVRGVHLISAVRQKDGTGRRSFNLQADLGALENEIAHIGNVRLVIIDPVSSYLGQDRQPQECGRAGNSRTARRYGVTAPRGRGIDHAFFQRRRAVRRKQLHRLNCVRGCRPGGVHRYARPRE